MRESVLVELFYVSACVAAAFLLVWVGLVPWLSLSLVLLPYLGRHLYYLSRLSSLIAKHHRLAPPFPRGVWGDVFRAIARHQQRARRQRKRQLRFTRRFREAAVSLPDGLVILNKLKCVEWANPAAAELLGVRWPRDNGRPLTEIVCHRQLGEVIDKADYSRSQEIAPEHNRAIMLSLRVTPFGERKRQRLIVARDITQLYHLNMIRRDFVANASHELRTPLTVIAGFLESLGDSPQTPNSHRRPIQLMVNQADRMRSIVEDLLTLSRLEMEDHSEDTGPVDVPEEVQLIIHEARALSDDLYDIEVDLDPDLFLTGNQAELRSAFSNLVFNAVKHNPPGTRIKVSWYRDGKNPVFSVSDDGEGIAAEHIPRLTERFYRIDKARSRASGGTGLGLAIVNHVLNRHDARLIVASELGHGCTFVCRFPESSSLHPARQPGSPESTKLTEQPSTIASAGSHR